MPNYDFRCEHGCGVLMPDVWRSVAERDIPPLCPDCSLPLSRFFSVSSNHRAAEDCIPGGLWLENYGAHPTKVYSHTERKRLLKYLPDGTMRRDRVTGQEYRLVEQVRHIGVPGSDRSPQTSNWSTMDAATLENARVLVSRVTGAPSTEARDPDDVPNEPGATAEGLALFNEMKTGREMMEWLDRAQSS